MMTKKDPDEKQRKVPAVRVDGWKKSIDEDRKIRGCEKDQKKTSLALKELVFKLRCSFSSDGSCTFGDTTINKKYISS